MKKKKFKFDLVTTYEPWPGYSKDDNTLWPGNDVIMYGEFFEKYKCCKYCLVNVLCLVISGKEDPKSVIERSIDVIKPCKAFWRVYAKDKDQDKS